jgi:hypothetical protein
MSERQIQLNPVTSTEEIDLSEDTGEKVETVSPERLHREATLQEWFTKRTPKASPANRKKSKPLHCHFNFIPHL